MIGLLLTTLACSSLDSMDSTNGADAPEGALEPGTLRIDVRPGADALELLPQSFVLAPGTYEDVTVGHQLEPTGTIHGLLTAETFLGWNSAAASKTGPLDAVVVADRGVLLQGGVAQTDEDGALSLSVPANQVYSIAILPNAATETPFFYLQNVPVSSPAAGGLDLTQTLGAGAPVYGRITDADGANVARVPLHLRRTDVDVTSATFYTDENGWYVARVQPGYPYALETEGLVRSNLAVPVVSAEFSIEAGDESGVQVDLAVGDRTAIPVSLQVVDPQGNALMHPHFRATSRTIEVGSLTVERDGQDDGVVSVSLPPGTWDLEVWPSNAYEDRAGTTLTPWSETVAVPTSGSVDLGTLTLIAPTTLRGQIEDGEGRGVGGVTVTAAELGSGGYTFATVTDDDGEYTLEVPRTGILLQAVPPTPDSGAYTHADLDLRAAGPNTDVSLTLVAGTELRGVARTADGTPVPFAVIDVYDYNSELLLARTLTDAEGAYAVRIDLPTETPDDGGTDTGDSDTGGGDTGDSDTGGADTGGDTGGADTAG